MTPEQALAHSVMEDCSFIKAKIMVAIETGKLDEDFAGQMKSFVDGLSDIEHDYMVDAVHMADELANSEPEFQSAEEMQRDTAHFQWRTGS